MTFPHCSVCDDERWLKDEPHTRCPQCNAEPWPAQVRTNVIARIVRQLWPGRRSR